ncbi:hypothetical protein EBZ39_03520, partial [bacterium]|nr:hypothetical protein [bacterium]
SNPLLVIWCGNIIAEDCCVVRAKEYADHVDVVNIRDAEGKSSWAAKNSEADIDRVLSLISYAAQQKEYFNNPMATGKTFPEITWGKCPPLHSLPLVITYADPATSNKDKPGQKSNLANSRKAVFTVGSDGHKFYIYTGFLDVMSNANFIASLYACRTYINAAARVPSLRGGSVATNEATSKRTPAYYYIENNTLQDPFYTQVLLPLIYSHAADIKQPVLPITPDPRKKDDKWFRIEAMLEPLNRTGRLVFNIDEMHNPHMERLATQFKSAKPTSKQLDGPDAIEGAIFLLQNKLQTIQAGTIKIINKPKTTKNHF